MISVVGMGMGLSHMTAEAIAALRSCDYVVAASKTVDPGDDGLLALRAAICATYGVELVVVADPERDREDPQDYPGAVRSWHLARVAAYREVITERPGRAGFLVWGDPALYDSTIRIVQELTDDFEVIAGISAPQLLAARHRIVLHRVGQPVHLTTARRLRADIAAGQANLCVMLTGTLDLAGLEGWSIWWGANLGTPSEALVSGTVGSVRDTIEGARAQAKAQAGWVMDVYLLRAPEEAAR